MRHDHVLKASQSLLFAWWGLWNQCVAGRPVGFAKSKMARMLHGTAAGTPRAMRTEVLQVSTQAVASRIGGVPQPLINSMGQALAYTPGSMHGRAVRGLARLGTQSAACSLTLRCMHPSRHVRVQPPGRDLPVPGGPAPHRGQQPTRQPALCPRQCRSNDHPCGARPRHGADPPRSCGPFAAGQAPFARYAPGTAHTPLVRQRRAHTMV